MTVMKTAVGEKLMRFARWYRIVRRVKRLINEGRGKFAVEEDGFRVEFDAAKEGDGR